jgi:hypothetical protein
MTKWQAVVFLFTILLTGLNTTASAQDVADDMLMAPPPPASPGLRIETSQNAPQPGRNYAPGVRYTTGAVRVSGWEKTLTDGDPNLRHWNWSAVTTYTQSAYGRVPAGAYLDKKKAPGGIYVKPVQIQPGAYLKKTTAYVSNNNEPDYVSNRSAKTGTGAKLIAPQYQPVQANNSNQTASNVTGRVRFKKPVAVAAAEPTAKTYSGDYTNANVGGRIMTDSTRSSRDVYGKLMRRPK